jgi:hypothetical protein
VIVDGDDDDNRNNGDWDGTEVGDFLDPSTRSRHFESLWSSRWESEMKRGFVLMSVADTRTVRPSREKKRWKKVDRLQSQVSWCVVLQPKCCTMVLWG